MATFLPAASPPFPTEPVGELHYLQTHVGCLFVFFFIPVLAWFSRDTTGKPTCGVTPIALRLRETPPEEQNSPYFSVLRS